ncbi:helix-turn-helix domain-containing protein [Streptodolium elevatio]
MPPKELDGSASALAFFGAELRYWRERAGLSQDALAAKLYCSPSLVAYIEQALRAPSLELATRADEILGTSGEFARMWPLVRRSGFAAFFEEIARLERMAKELSYFATMVVPGLLQTPEYARAVVRAGQPDREEDFVEAAVEARMARQTVLRAEVRPAVWFVIDEAVLLRGFAGREVMMEQLRHILDVSRLPKVCVQILRLRGEPSPGVDGFSQLMRFEDGPDISYVEGMAGGHAIVDPERVAQCVRKFELLRAVAASPEESRKIIRDVLEAM